MRLVIDCVIFKKVIVNEDLNKTFLDFCTLFQQYQKQKLDLPTINLDDIIDAILGEIKPHLNRQRMVVYDNIEPIGIIILDLISATQTIHIAKLQFYLKPTQEHHWRELLGYVVNNIPEKFSDLRIELYNDFIDIKEMNFVHIQDNHIYCLDLAKLTQSDQGQQEHPVQGISYIGIRNGSFNLDSKLMNQYLLIQQHQYKLSISDLERSHHENLIERWNSKKYDEQSVDTTEWLVLPELNGHIIGTCRVSYHQKNPYVAYLEDIGLIDDYHEIDLMSSLVKQTISLIQEEQPDLQYLLYEEIGQAQIIDFIMVAGFEICQTISSHKWKREDWFRINQTN